MFSSGSFSDSSFSYVLNTLPLYGKAPFSKKLIIWSLPSDNSLADSKTVSFSFTFFELLGLYLLFSLFINILNSVWSSIASFRVIS